MVMADGATPRDTFVLKRGAYDAPGEKVTPGIPGGPAALRPDWPRDRLGLARWLVDRVESADRARHRESLLADRTSATGIVKTVDDFGSQGEWPVHPELLDWLAVEFMESGWNVKALQKTIVMQRGLPAIVEGHARAAARRIPDNRLLARGPRFRLGRR